MAPAMKKRPPRPLKVALAEDEEEQRVVLERVLRDEGFDVVAFEDGYEMLDYFELAGGAVSWPDAVVADVHMPGRTGVEVLEMARARGLSAPIIVVTGYPSRELEQRVTALGRALLISKPLDVDRLVRAIAALGELHAPP